MRLAGRSFLQSLGKRPCSVLILRNICSPHTLNAAAMVRAAVLPWPSSAKGQNAVCMIVKRGRIGGDLMSFSQAGHLSADGRLGAEIPAEKNLFHFPACHRSRSDAGPHQPASGLRAGGSAGGGRACEGYHEKFRLAQSGRLRRGYRVMAAAKSAGDKSENGAQGITRLSQDAEASCLKSFDTTHG
jgi:hypothetical protein